MYASIVFEQAEVVVPIFIAINGFIINYLMGARASHRLRRPEELD